MTASWLYILLLVLLVEEALSLINAAVNWRHAVKGCSRRRPAGFTPRVLLIVPCKGLDQGFRANITSLLHQDYPDYMVWFVVGHRSDPAYTQIRAILANQAGLAKATRLLVAGPCTTSSQKVHNLLYAIDQAPADVDVFAFADSDIQAPRTWLSDLIAPLAGPACGASTGYRWFVPSEGNLASTVLSCLNAKVAQMLGPGTFNLAWGGSMAIRKETFYSCNIQQIWSQCLSDDLTVSEAVKARGLRIRFVPRCLVPSHCRMGWLDLVRFGRRQLFLTRLYSPLTWILALTGTALATIDIWGIQAVAAWSWWRHWQVDVYGLTAPAWP
ncbi:MAG: glycosyltransferase, partial [Sedimentisphaerales bacterium]|nr:glycosyltransferase [Sedimentisphaerales bacterium]